MVARVKVYMEATPQPAVIAQAFFATAEKCRRLDEPLMQAAEVASEEMNMNFEAGGRPEGWEPLSEATIVRKSTKGLSPDQKSTLSDLKKDSKFEGDLVTDESGEAHFVPSPTSKFAMVMQGLASSVRILVDTESLMGGASDPANFEVKNIGANFWYADFADPTGYGGYHVDGTLHMPSRDWTYVSEDGVDRMAEFFADWVAS
jgi:hypothetical protein